MTEGEISKEREVQGKAEGELQSSQDRGSAGQEASTGQKGAPAGEEVVPEIKALHEELAQKGQELKEQEERYLRLRAEFENFKKRQQEKLDGMVKFANEVLISALLPVLDSFKRALSSPYSDVESLVKGMALVGKQLEDVLKRAGLEEIKAQGKPFNPLLHEAVMEKEAQGFPPGTVIEELQKGYLLQGHVIRPTMVVVAKESSSSS